MDCIFHGSSLPYMVKARQIHAPLTNKHNSSNQWTSDQEFKQRVQHTKPHDAQVFKKSMKTIDRNRKVRSRGLTRALTRDCQNVGLYTTPFLSLKWDNSRVWQCDYRTIDVDTQECCEKRALRAPVAPTILRLTDPPTVTSSRWCFDYQYRVTSNSVHSIHDELTISLEQAV